MYAILASICFAATWKQGSTTFRLRRSSGIHCNATIQETFPRATLHLLHRYPFIPRILPCCVSQQRSARLASAPSEVSCIRFGYHTSLTGFVGKIRSSYLSFPMLLYEKRIFGEPGRRGFSRAPKMIVTNISKLFYSISPDSILTASSYPLFANAS